MSCITIIKNFKDTYTPMETRLADYILNNINEVKKLTSNELAKSVGVSQSAVVKFCKKIGYSGYMDFRVALSEISTHLNDNYIHNHIQKNDSAKTIMRKIAHENKNAIDSTIEINMHETFIETVKLLDTSNRIILLGIGASSLVAQDFTYKLLKLGKSAIFDPSSHIQITNTISLKEDDIVFAISFSGKTQEVLLAAEEAKKRGCKVISLTKLPVNPLSEIADINLFAASQEGMFRTSAISSRIAQLTVIDILFILLVLEHPDESIPLIERSSDILRYLRS